MKLLKQLLCSHKWEGSGFSYARCQKCDKSKYAPEIARAAINKYCSSMVDAKHWDQAEVTREKIKRGML